MQLFRLSCLIILTLFAAQVSAQVIDNTSTFKSTNTNRYIRYHYDNDYFTKTDEYYTQGMTLELVHPGLKKNPLTKLLIRPTNSDYKYGLAIVNIGYTPTSTRQDVILYGDRPFSSTLALSSFVSAKDTIKRQQISSFITIGLIGQGAGGEEQHIAIHRWLKNPAPHGWQFQIQNDLALTYQINFEKELLRAANHFLLNAAADVKVGTHTDRVKAGFNFMVGSFNDPYQPARIATSNRKKFRYYLYGQIQPGFTAYDATLQGGMFNRKSPYTIAASDITRFTLQGDYGIAVNFRKIYLEYCQSILTREFKTGGSHRWGGIRLGIGL